MEVREIALSERPRALELVFHTFMQYEAPDYTKEGVETFEDTVIHNNEFIDSIMWYGAFEGDKIRGVLATRNEGNHIALFFVDGKFHKQGIGKALFLKALEKSTSNEMTVHSSPYAVPIYRHLGFAETAPEQLTDGIRYTPMIYKKCMEKEVFSQYASSSIETDEGN